MIVRLDAARWAALFLLALIIAICLVPACALVRVATEQQTVVQHDTVHVIVRDTVRVRRFEVE